MDIYKLREGVTRLRNANTLKDGVDMLNIFAEYFLRVVVNHQDEPVYSLADRDAAMLNQMMLTKVLHLRKLIDDEGVGFESSGGLKLQPIVDPTIIASLVRNIYETVGLFNLIYVRANTSDEKKIIYSLWVISGLKYRQRFGSIAKLPENKELLAAEAKQIQDFINIIENTDLFKSLSEDNQKKIRKQIKDKEYRVSV